MYINTDVMGEKIRINQAISAQKIQETMQKLSTGLRINSASDDAAGLEIDTRIQAAINENKQGIKNMQSGMDMLSTMDSGLTTVEGMIQRIRELVIQGQNGTLSNSDRATVQQELDQLTSGIEQISKSTTYNNMKVINRSLLSFNGINNYVDMGQNLENVATQSHTFEATFNPTNNTSKEEDVFDMQGWHHNIVTYPNNRIGFGTWFVDASGTRQYYNISSPNNIYKEGDQIQVDGVVDTTNKKIYLYVNGKQVSSMSFPTGKQLLDYTKIADGNFRMGIANLPGTVYSYPYYGTVSNARVYNTALSSSDIQNNLDGNTTQNGLQGEWLADNGGGTTLYDTNNQNNGAVNGATFINDSISISSGSKSSDVLNINLTNVSASVLGLDTLSVNDPNALQTIDQALNTVLSEHSRIGGTINQLKYRTESLQTSEQSATEAQSRIADSNTEEEASNLTKEQIKLQSSLAMLQKNNAYRESSISLLNA